MSLTQVAADGIQRRLRSLAYPPMSVADVLVADLGTEEGPSVLVTIKLSSSLPDGKWDSAAFGSIRRAARTTVLEELGGEDARLVYESDVPDDATDVPVQSGAKRSSIEEGAA
ncbi:MAG: hypothetical protein ACOYEV_02140 [Candidatus Nanopelagicales bacterium]